MIRNRYNRIPHPSTDTIRERNTNKSRRHEEITTQSGSQEISSFPVDVHNEQIVKDLQEADEQIQLE